MKTTVKTFAMAAMMLMGTATTFAMTNPGMRNDNRDKAATVVVYNSSNRDTHTNDHLYRPMDHLTVRPMSRPMNHIDRPMNRPMHDCYDKHSKKMKREMKRAKRHEAEMRRMEAARNENNIVVYERTDRGDYVVRH